MKLINIANSLFLLKLFLLLSVSIELLVWKIYASPRSLYIDLNQITRAVVSFKYTSMMPGIFRIKIRFVDRRGVQRIDAALKYPSIDKWEYQSKKRAKF
jgi:hypothetical protein